MQPLCYVATKVSTFATGWLSFLYVGITFENFLFDQRRNNDIIPEF